MENNTTFISLTALKDNLEPGILKQQKQKDKNQYDQKNRPKRIN